MAESNDKPSILCAPLGIEWWLLAGLHVAQVNQARGRATATQWNNDTSAKSGELKQTMVA